MAADDSDFKLSMAVPNGIILGLIGLLVLITPWTTAVPSEQVAMDVIAGGALFVGGAISLVLGLARQRRSGHKEDSHA